MSWFEEQSAAVERKVLSREWEGKPARSVIVSRIYPTAIEDLWDAITTPDRMSRWFMPVSGDLREGGRYQLEGNAGGTINRCAPPSELAVTWEFNGGVGWVNVTLEEEGPGSTRLTLEHIGHEDEAYLGFWNQFGPGAVGVGWDLSLLGLAFHLRDREWTRPEDEAAFLGSGEGREFALASSKLWGDAAIAFGTEEKAAREAAERTSAFYTGGMEGQGGSGGG